jgi:hypothetical protein
MHDHDLDLIAEHASGLLSGADASRAADLVETCDICAGEFVDQRQIATLLMAAPMPAMSELERTRLRRSVLDAVGTAPATAVAPWHRRFLPLLSAAAAVTVVAVGIGVVGQLGGGDDTVTLADGGADTATTAAASDAFVPMADTDDSSGIASESLEDEAASELSADAESARSSSVLLDMTQSDVVLDTVLAELTALIAETEEVVDLQQALEFGATCAESVEEPILGVVLAVVDGQRTQVFLTGDRSEPSLTMLVEADCAP